MVDSTQIGDYIMCALEGHQIKCGLTTPLFELDFDKYGILVSDSIVKILWAFAWKHGFWVVSNHKCLKTLRERNMGIMDTIISNDNVSQHNVLDINECRTYLKDFTLADVTTGCGKYIEDTYTRLCKHIPEKSAWNWPYQPQPTNKLLSGKCG